jgi:hypothetical protein
MPVRRYIARQQEHHTRIRFEDELVSLLKRHQMEYDESVIWWADFRRPFRLRRLVESVTQGSARGSTLGYCPTTLRVLGGRSGVADRSLVAAADAVRGA